MSESEKETNCLDYLPIQQPHNQQTEHGVYHMENSNISFIKGPRGSTQVSAIQFYHNRQAVLYMHDT